MARGAKQVITEEKTALVATDKKLLAQAFSLVRERKHKVAIMEVTQHGAPYEYTHTEEVVFSRRSKPEYQGVVYKNFREMCRKNDVCYKKLKSLADINSISRRDAFIMLKEGAE